ncbi:MAG: acetoacetate decarboxylase family protein [Oligoflexia bacterium]|nr:acetoacetate decarboxylase family protein [Oligoflexia bacterium]
MKEVDFFSRYKQEDISIRQYSGKSPMFFRDIFSFGALFALPITVAEELTREVGLKPLRLPSGDGIIGLWCFEYKDSDIGPYNESAMSVLVQGPSLTSLVRESHIHILKLPVTTEVALFGGIDYLGYPKVMADVRFTKTQTHHICEVNDLWRLQVKLCHLWRLPIERRVVTYPTLNGVAMTAELEFNILRMGMSLKHSAAQLNILDKTLAKMLGGKAQISSYGAIVIDKAQAILKRPQVRVL